MRLIYAVDIRKGMVLKTNPNPVSSVSYAEGQVVVYYHGVTKAEVFMRNRLVEAVSMPPERGSIRQQVQHLETEMQCLDDGRPWLEVDLVPTFSISHLTQQDCTWLTDHDTGEWPVSGLEGTYGFEFWAGQDEEDLDWTELPSLLLLIRAVREMGFKRFRLDADAWDNIIPGVPTHDW